MLSPLGEACRALQAAPRAWRNAAALSIYGYRLIGTGGKGVKEAVDNGDIRKVLRRSVCMRKEEEKKGLLPVTTRRHMRRARYRDRWLFFFFFTPTVQRICSAECSKPTCANTRLACM